MGLIFSILTDSKNRLLAIWVIRYYVFVFALTGYECRRHNDVNKSKNIIMLYII